jgi:hypothetical protein
MSDHHGVDPTQKRRKIFVQNYACHPCAMPMMIVRVPRGIYGKAPINLKKRRQQRMRTAYAAIQHANPRRIGGWLDDPLQKPVRRGGLQPVIRRRPEP